MKSKIIVGIIFAIVFVQSSSVMAWWWGGDDPDYRSPIALAVDKEGKTLYVAESTAGRIASVDIETGQLKKELKVPGSPSGLSFAPDGSALYVTLEELEGKLAVVKLPKFKVSSLIDVGHSPVAPVPSPDGKYVYVCNRFNNSIGIVDIAKGKQTGSVPVTREPYAMAVTPDGKTLFAVNLLPGGAADADYVAAVVSVIDTAGAKVVSEIKLPNGSTSLRGICVSADGKHVYVVHTLSRYQLPTTQLERGWMNTSAMSVIDAAAKTLVNTVLLDEVNQGAANPWGVVCTADGRFVCVSHSGTHEISIINRQELHVKLNKAAKGEKVSDASTSSADVPNDLSFLVGIRDRVKLTGNGPRGIAAAGSKVYAAQYFSDDVSVVDLNSGGRYEAKQIGLGNKTAMSNVRKGEMFFFDAALCFQNWQSCGTCHPDARVDALNWDLLNDGIGNPKQTKNMLMSHVTPPAMSTGIRESAEMAVRKGIQFIQFAVRPEEDAVALDEYLKSLKPVPSPYLVKGKLSSSAARGKIVYKKAQCASCHHPPLYTDMQHYDVGTGTGSETNRLFDTPTLIEIWRTAPYLYDGRAGTIEDLIGKHNKGDKHGQTSDLTPAERKDLVEYILSL